MYKQYGKSRVIENSIHLPRKQKNNDVIDFTEEKYV